MLPNSLKIALIEYLCYHDHPFEDAEVAAFMAKNIDAERQIDNVYFVRPQSDLLMVYRAYSSISVWPIEEDFVLSENKDYITMKSKQIQWRYGYKFLDTWGKGIAKLIGSLKVEVTTKTSQKFIVSPVEAVQILPAIQAYMTSRNMLVADIEIIRVKGDFVIFTL